MEDEPNAAAIAVLEYTTGPARGKNSLLSAAAVDVLLTDDRLVHLVEASIEEPLQNLIARLHLSGPTYEIEAFEEHPVWVNGERITVRRLENGDMIEFGDTGPLSRFRLFGADKPRAKTISDILTDSVTYLRVSRRPPFIRLWIVVCDLLRRMTRETTLLFRSMVIIAVIVLAAVTYQQSRLNALLQQQITNSSARLDAFAAAIARAGEQALRPSDLDALRRDLAGEMSLNAERLAALEKRSRASARIISESAPSVLFLQGAYGFRDRSSKKMLRQVVDEDGRPMMSPFGQPLLSLEGEGPVAERQFTGTGFSIAGKDALITNRHVALPWENDAGADTFSGLALEPVMIKLIGYRPGDPVAVPLKLLRTGKDVDLAILRRVDNGPSIPGLKLADGASTAGDEVLVMGYPTGLRSMLAQSGEAFIKELQRTKDIGFWSVAARLAKEGYIAPLASRGIIGQATGATVVYDAETTQGGSGGPVIDSNGKVVAVNTAILPEYGGSNLGVPVAKVRSLLKEAGLR
jgi:serine protease Do